MSQELTINVTEFGNGAAMLAETASVILELPQVKEYLYRTRHRLVSLELIDPDEERGRKYQRPAKPRRFRAQIVDYTRNRTIHISGPLADVQRVQVTESSRQPLPDDDEFEAAVALVMESDHQIAEAIAAGALLPYRAMPALVSTELADGRVERTIAVGLLPRDQELRHQIVGANLITRAVERYEALAPNGSLANSDICDPEPSAGQPTASKGTPGQARVRVRQGGTTLWTFLVVRPAASSGTNGSGIELRYVEYRGTRVLYRAHVPILNVRYDNDSCGPYRDWQFQESMIKATGTDVAPGFRLCPTPALTFLDDGDDTGNFLGTAIYVQGQEVVLVSEMQAGWYRYISEWRLHANGTIKPRFGFDAVASSCTCNTHHHHAYWRFDFDIRTAGNNVVKEFNDPPIIGNSKWHTKRYEIKRPRNPARGRRWRVLNKDSGEGYTVIPGSNDGVATQTPDYPFSQGDVWILRYHGDELDDGRAALTTPAEADLDRFVNGEHIDGRDVVLWYGGHFTHDQSTPEDVSHVVGPTLVPYNWT